MALLTVAPYDPWKQTAWVGDLIKLSAQMREEKAKRQQQAAQQALADQRRSFEFDRRLEFERARTAADDVRADARLDMERQIFAEDRAPFALPPSLGPSSGGSSGGMGGDLPSSGPVDAGSLPPLEQGPPAEPVDNSGDVPSMPSFLPAPPPVATMPALGAEEEDQFELDPVSGNPKLVKAGRGTVGAEMQSIPRDGRGRILTGPVSGGVVNPAAELPQVQGLSGEPSLFPNAAVPRATGTPASHAANLARELAGTGLFNRKQAGQILTQAAASEASRRPESSKPMVRNFTDGTTKQFMGTDADGQPIWKKLAEKPKVESEDLADVVGDATYNKEHGTYVRKDGSEFFPGRSASGKWTVKPFMPSQTPAKLLWGDDGNVYPVDSKGEYLKPKPEGVQVRDHASLQTVDVDGARWIVNPDQSTRLLIPAGVPLTAAQRNKYTEASQALRAAEVEVDAQTKLKLENPSKMGVTWFGGGTQGAVDAAKKKFDSAKAAVEQWRKDFPQLDAKNIPATAQAQPSGAIPKVTGPDDPAYKALPSGSVYFGPDGAKARKK